MILSFFSFQNIKIKLSSRTCMALKSSLVIFQALKTSSASVASAASLALTAVIPKKTLPNPDDMISPGTQMTKTGPFLWKRSWKIQLFTDTWYLFCWRLLRPAYVTFLKTGCKYQNIITSGIYRTHYIYEIINPDTCQSQITLPISIWDTLYVL